MSLWIAPLRDESWLRRVWGRVAWRLWRHRRWQVMGAMIEAVPAYVSPCADGHDWFPLRVRRSLSGWPEPGSTRPAPVYPDGFDTSWCCHRCLSSVVTPSTETPDNAEAPPPGP